jgi:hypothetical protein
MYLAATPLIIADGMATMVILHPITTIRDTTLLMVLSVETNIYTLNPDKLIWSGITETMNPNSAQTTIKEIADAISYKMKSEKFLVTSDKKK